MKLYLRSSTIKRITEYGSYVFYFTAAGVDVVDPVTRTVVAYADVANTVTGAVNANGVYIGTLASGVYFISHANVASGGNRTADGVLKLSTAGTTPLLPTGGNAIKDMDGSGTVLMIGTAVGACYLPDTATLYKNTVSGGCTSISISGNYIFWNVGAVAYSCAAPLGDWSWGKAVSESTQPSISGATSASVGVQANLYGDDWDGRPYGRCNISGQEFVFSGGYGPSCVKINTSTYAPTKVPFNPVLFAGYNTVSTINVGVFYNGIDACDAGYCAIAVRNGTGTPASGYSIQIGLFKYDSAGNVWNQIPFVLGEPLTTVWQVAWVGDYLVVCGAHATAGFVLQLYSRSGDTMTYVGQPITALQAPPTYHYNGRQLLQLGSTPFFIYQSPSTTYVFKVANNTINQTGTYGVPNGIYAQSEIFVQWSGLSSQNTLAVSSVYYQGYPNNQSQRSLALVRFDPITGTLSTIWNTPYGTTPEAQWNYGSRTPALHPSGRFIVISNGTWAYVYYFNGTNSCSIATTIGIAAGDCPWCHFLNDSIFCSSSNQGSNLARIETYSFTYATMPVTVSNTVINEIASGANGNGFVATDAGLLTYDCNTGECHGIKDIFGVTNNVKSLHATPGSKYGCGVLSYGTNLGTGVGQMGVISLNSLYSMVTHSGDQGPVWSAGLDAIAYLDNMDRVEDAVSSTRKLVMLGLTVKSIVKHNGYMYHFTEAGLDVHRIADGARTCWALVANTVCGTVNDNGVYFGTTAGVKKLTHANIDSGVEQTANVTVAYSTTTSPPIQSNTITDLAGHGTALAIATSAGVDFLPDAATIYHRTIAGGGKAVAVDETRFAWSESNHAYFMPHPAADWTAGSATQVPNVPGTVINAQRFGADLFVATDAGIVVLDTVAAQTKVISTELGEVRNVVAIHPTSIASRSQGLLAYGLSYMDGTGKFGVFDMSTLT